MSPSARTLLVSSCLLLSFILTDAAFSQTEQTGETRGTWADAWQTDLHSASGITALVNQIRSANMNSIVAQVRRRGDSLYNSNFEPRIKQLTNSTFDPLADLLEKAHNTNDGPRIEVHAWIVTYPIWSGTNSGSNAVLPTHPLNLHPDWLSRSNGMNGPNYTGAGYVFDPGHPEVQKHTFNVAMDIISRYDVDGLDFDYVRYPEYGAAGDFQPWGYNPVSIARFNKLYGRTGEPLATDPQFSQFRRDQVTALVRKIYLSAIAIKPHVKISADLITWNPSPTNPTAWTNGANAYRSVMQDWRSWMEEGILDISRPMTYYRQGVHPNDYANWMNFAKDHRYNRHTIIGPGTYLNFDTNAVVQMRATRLPSQNGNLGQGVCNYSYRTPSTNGLTPRATMYRAFAEPGVTNQNGTMIDPSPTPIFDTPVSVVPMPWKTAPTRGHLKGFLYGGNPTNTIDGGTFSISGPITRELDSDGTGFFGAVDLIPGNYTANLSITGYESFSTNFTVTVGQVQHLDFVLLPAISITEHPGSRTVHVGTNVSFSVSATGQAPFTYQWRFNNIDVSGATNPVFSRINVQYEDEGNYSVVISNARSSAQSSSAYLRVTSPVRPTGAEPLWSIAPGASAYMTTNSTERGLAFNPVTTNLLLVSRAGGANIVVLNSDTGDTIRLMNTDSAIINGGYTNFALQVAGVADDGAVYACNMVLTGDGFKIYRWANDSHSTEPTVAFSGNPWPSTSSRWGDSIAVRGAGRNTQILVGARAGDNFCIFTTTDGLIFTPTRFAVSGVSGTIGVAFGRANTFWAKNVGQPLNEIAFDLAASSAFIANAISTDAVPASVSVIGVNTPLDLIAGISLETPDKLRVYEALNLPPALIASAGFPDKPNPNNTGAIAFGKDRVFALNSNNGILALRLMPRFPIRFQSVERLSNGRLGFQTDSDPVPNTVQSSPDFLSWETVTNVLPTNGYFEISEPNTNSAHKFFRTRIP